MPEEPVRKPVTRRLPDNAVQRLRSLDEQEQALSAQLADPDIAADPRKARDLATQRRAIEPVVTAFRELVGLEREIESVAATAQSDPDAEMRALADEELESLTPRADAAAEKVLAALVTSEDQRIGSVMLEIRAGTGGDEAALWARDLFEMYSRYAAGRGWSVDVLDAQAEAGAGGLRSVTANIKGEGVWSVLSFEPGVHQVKRVPATESQGRIHTSTATVAVLPEPEEVDVKIDWANDVEENVTTSQGPGGQNVNKVATAVQLHHKPSGIVIRMQESKSQHQNRDKAKRLLMAKLYELERRRQHEERSQARRTQIGLGERSEKIRTYRWKDGIVADERLPGQYALKDVMAGNMAKLMDDLTKQEIARRLSEL